MSSYDEWLNGNIPTPDVMATEFRCDVCGTWFGPIGVTGGYSITMTSRCQCGTVVEIVSKP